MLRKKRNRQRGQAIVELALLFPFFLLIIVGGLIDFGFAFYNALTLQQLANDTAQWAAENHIKLDSDIKNYIGSKKPGWWQGVFHDPAIARVTLITGGTVIKIGIKYESPAYTPFYQTMLSATSGAPSIGLSALASYKEPEHVITRL
ncbi:MAG TPA: hypothetical protein DCG57_10175 [Candidatus Riflebacteria bacterium]|nr:hypothetical protein [Candidatus Riflebacteria bacterium]